MFRRRQEAQSSDDELDWTEDDMHSDDSASSSFSSDLRSDDGSDASSHDDEESTCSSDSSPRRPIRSLWHDGGFLGGVSSIRRRATGRSSSPNQSDASNDRNTWDEANSSGSRDSKHRRRRRRDSFSLWQCFDVYHERCPALCSRRSTVVLLVSFVVWLFVRSVYGGDSSGWVNTDDPFQPGGSVKEDAVKRLQELQNERRKEEAKNTLGTAAVGDVVRGAMDSLANFVGSKPKKNRKKGGRVEVVPNGCRWTDWQTKSFPTCNDIHEIDLRESLHLKKGGPKLPDMGIGDQSEIMVFEREAVTARKIGYVGSGLWRSVWKVDPRGELLGEIGTDGSFVAPAVLKMMKAEHKVDQRNLDRHRRDALVMERLTASPYVVSIYGYCGNTVLTEYVGADLAQIIYHGVDVEGGMLHNHTRQTSIGRLRLAVDVARGLAAIHDLPGGPVIHADIQAKQFLVDPVIGVKINDFNRCRLMPKSVTTGNPCPIKIPSAPGAARSPEEYESKKLTEKIDIYSTANVLYGILTGMKPWNDYSTNTIKKNVKAGSKPSFGSIKLKPGTSDAALASLVQDAYELRPENRINASHLVAELELLLKAEETKANNL